MRFKIELEEHDWSVELSIPDIDMFEQLMEAIREDKVRVTVETVVWDRYQ